MQSSTALVYVLSVLVLNEKVRPVDVEWVGRPWDGAVLGPAAYDSRPPPPPSPSHPSRSPMQQPIFVHLNHARQATSAKSSAVGLSVIGVVLVSAAPQRVTAAGIHPDTGGYLWLMVSVMLYAVFEVRSIFLIEAPSLVTTTNGRAP